MRKYLTALGILGLTLAMVGVLGSVAWAQGPPGVTAEAAELDSVSGDADEINGFGLAAVASGFFLSGDDKIWGVEVENLRTNQEYFLNNNAGADCTGQIGTFNTGPDGAATESFMSAADVEDEVTVCRNSTLVLTGTLAVVNQAVRGRGRP